MKWTISKFKTSLMGLLGKPEPASNSTIDNRCEDIREAMLLVMEQCDSNAATAAVANRIFHAGNIEALWYLRSTVLAHLIVARGENRARELLLPIKLMFKGFIPDTMAPRARKRHDVG